MPHRHTNYIERCTICDRPADDRCARCQKPLCNDHHLPAADARCETCEADFDRRQEGLIRPRPEPLTGVFRTGVLLPTAGMAGLGGLIGVLIAAVSVITGSAGLFEGLMALLVMMLLFGMLGFVPTLLLYLAIGTPLFARRKLHTPVQKLRLWHERRKFLPEGSAKKALATPDSDPKAEWSNSPGSTGQERPADTEEPAK